MIEDAVITGQTVTYSITDDGDLDQDKTRGTLRDPVALAFPEGEAPAEAGHTCAAAAVATRCPHGRSGLAGLPALTAGVVW